MTAQETGVDAVTRMIAGRIGVLTAAALVTIYALLAASPLHDETAAALLSNLLISAVAGLVAYVFLRAAMRGGGFPRRAAIFVGMGAGAWSLGQAMTFALHLTRAGAGFPSAADVALLLAPLFALLGVIAIIPKTMPPLTKVRGFLDGVIITASSFSIVWILFLGEAVRALPALQFGILLYYPVMDILLFASMLAFYPQMVQQLQQRGRPWAVVVVGFACLGAANVWFTYAAFKDIPTGASWGETVWVVAACLLAIGGARLVTQPAELKPAALRPRELLVPFLPTAIGLVIGTWELGMRHTLDLEVVVAGMVLVLSFMSRQIVWSVENYRMTRQSFDSHHRIEALAKKLETEHASLVHKNEELMAAEQLSRIGSWWWEPESGRFEASVGLHALFPGVVMHAFDDFMRIVSEDDLPRLSGSVDRALSGELAVELEFQTRGPNPSPFRGILQSQRLDPHVPRLVCLVQDVTEQKKADHAAEASQVEVSRLLAVDEFKTNLLRTASHELNTPLGVLRLQLYVLGKELESHGLHNMQAFRILDRNVERLATLVKDMLDVARLQSGRLQMAMQPTDVNVLIGEMYDSFRPMAERENLFLSVESPSHLRATLDPRRMTQVLYNFLTNAIKFTPAGGRIRLCAEPTGGRLRLSVHDTGVGLRDDQISRLFQPFSQVHDMKAPNAAPGTGLGLYICRAIVEQHGGRVWAESGGPGQGARFYAEVPLEVRAQEPVSASMPAAVPGPHAMTLTS